MRITFAAAIAAAATLGPSALAVPGMTSWAATLTAAQEVPRQVVKDTRAHGSFLARLRGSKLTFRLTFGGLTGGAVAAHIHLGAKGQAGNVVLPLCSPCKSPVTGTLRVDAQARQEFARHLLYVNILTKKNPEGEIRGQLGT